ncbi:MAG: hypothetical protein LUE29_03525 [Lachnospiraceae bacterium]|nr:hypothetical protein [Lachnospiraceae bacterium]
MASMNPKTIMKLMNARNELFDRHPKLSGFLQAAQGELQEGAVIDLAITAPDGHVIKTNMKIQPEDMQLLESLKDIK